MIDKFVIGKTVDGAGYVICNRIGTSYEYISADSMHKLRNVCKFNNNKLAILDKGLNPITRAITVLGKYYNGKKDKSNLLYFICDESKRRKSITKDELLHLNNTCNITNIIVGKDKSIRFIAGPIPNIDNIAHTIMHKISTVTKLSGLLSGTSGTIGVSKKFIGCRHSDKRIGIVKFPLGNRFDILNEVVIYRLGLLLGYDIAESSIEAYRQSMCVISLYKDSMKDTGSIISLKTAIGDTTNFHAKFNLKWVKQRFSQDAVNKYIQMIILDIITHQVDRHISNIAFYEKSMYSLYDNGRALFFDNIEEAMRSVKLDIRGDIADSFITNEHGYGWTYLEDVLGYNNYKHLIRHDLKYSNFIKLFDQLYPDNCIRKINWLAEYMFKAYLIVTRQEARWDERR